MSVLLVIGAVFLGLWLLSNTFRLIVLLIKLGCIAFGLLWIIAMLAKH